MSDDELMLSNEAASALQEFLNETVYEQTTIQKPSFKEDWNLSQFWYSEDTSNKICDVIDHLIQNNSQIENVALISCPSIFLTIQNPERKQMLNNLNFKLFEYDRRFASFDEFQFYDYNYPLDILKDHKNNFDIIIADPPYLSEECLVKTLCTVKSLIKNTNNNQSYIMLLTGKVMKDIALREYDLRPVSYQPQHENKLANEFMLYTNFELKSIIGCFYDN